MRTNNAPCSTCKAHRPQLWGSIPHNRSGGRERAGWARRSPARGGATPLGQAAPAPPWPHYHLAADFVRDLVLAAESEHGRDPFDAGLGLDGPGAVVKAGAEDAVVVAALVSGRFAFFFYHQ